MTLLKDTTRRLQTLIHTAIGSVTLRKGSLVFLSVPLIVLLAGCSGILNEQPEPLTVKTEEVKVTKFHPPVPAAVTAPEVEIVILTPETTAQLNEEVAEGKTLPYSFFGLSSNDYLSLSQFMQRWKSWSEQMVEIVNFYRKDE